MQHLVPQQIVLHAPALAVQCQRGVALIADFFQQVGGHRLGLGGAALVTGQAGIAGHAHNGLGGQIDVVCQMPGKVVGTQLLGRVLTILYQILDPVVQQRAVLISQCLVRAKGAGGLQHDQHITALFHRHLVARIPHIRTGRVQVVRRVAGRAANGFAGSVNLAGGQRVTADIMRGKIAVPNRH